MRPSAALGATPVRVPAQASLDGLDAIDSGASSVQGNEYYDTARFLTANIICGRDQSC